MKLTFCGAAGQVTGSCYLLESGGHQILIDCGLFQGTNMAEQENYGPFPFDATKIEAVFVTHAHLDHTGRLPKLHRDGFTGTIYSTPPTKDCAEFILLDSENLLAHEAQRHGHEPICTTGEVENVMQQWQTLNYHETHQQGPFTITLYNAGHILGSSIAKIDVEGKTIVFSGDLGNYPPPIIQPTEFLDGADICAIDGTYGDSVHAPDSTRREMLDSVIEETVKAGGVLMIPAFALERTQELMFYIDELMTRNQVPRVPVFIDSPLAIKLSSVYQKYPEYLNKEAHSFTQAGDKLFNFPSLRFTLTSDESKAINDVPNPKIIMAGSGMMHGGRIMHHAKRYLSDPNSTVLFIGYQAQGSLGRRVMEGAKTVHIFGEPIAVHCKVRVITSYSAHADKPKLLEWLGHLKPQLKQLFVIHSEQPTAEAFAKTTQAELGVASLVPKVGQTVEL
jgi:metallo-beta-lactamase family protein